MSNANNPLNSIALHLEVLRARIENQDALAESEIDVISREITRLDRVVKTFLDFTRPLDLNLVEIEAGQLDILATTIHRLQQALKCRYEDLLA